MSIDAIKALGIESVDSGEIETLCQELLEANPKVVEDVSGGNEKAVGVADWTGQEEESQCESASGPRDRATVDQRFVLDSESSGSPDPDARLGESATIA